MPLVARRWSRRRVLPLAAAAPPGTGPGRFRRAERGEEHLVIVAGRRPGGRDMAVNVCALFKRGGAGDCDDQSDHGSHDVPQETTI